MNNYEDIEFVVYSETRAAFESLVTAGDIDTTQIGLIGDTGEVWINGKYYPLTPEYVKLGKDTDTSEQNTLLGWVNALQTTLSVSVRTIKTENETIYRIYKGLRRIASIPIPKLSGTNFIQFTPTTGTDQDTEDEEDQGESIVSGIKIEPVTQTIADATSENDGLATANDVREALEDYVKKGDSVDVSIANDLTGVLQATEEQFVYRASAGANKSIRDESAVIRKIKGSSVVWEQKLRTPEAGAWTPYIPDNLTVDINGREIKATLNGGVTITNPYQAGIFPNIPYGSIVGHKYLFCASVMTSHLDSSQGNNFSFEQDGNAYTLYPDVGRTNTWTFVSGIWQSSANNNRISSIRPPWAFCTASEGQWFAIKDAMLFDLTIMFGEGKEPNTIEEFRELFPLSYYDYAEPMIKGMSVNSIKTTGFNNFSKVRAANNIINDDGTLGTSYVYSVDTFKVLPNTVYYLKDVANGANTNTYAFYDSSMSLISTGKASIGSDLNVTTSISTPSNAAYMAIACHNDYLDTCCVNIRHTGVHDGEYKDYEEHILTIPEIAKHFPYGMQGIDDVYDEITPNGITKRLGVIPLNTLSWMYDSRSSCWRGAGIRNKVPLLALSNRYEIKNVEVTELTEGQITSIGGSLICLKLSSVATVEDLYDTLDGAYIVYELYDEEHISLDSPLQLDYWVSDWGTEDAISEDVSTPFKADIVYAFNAEGRIRDNERNIERLEENLNQMVAPYIIKSFRAGDFTEYEDVLVMDISPDDLLGGAISQAIRNNRPVYLKVGTTTAPMGGLCAMQYCYEDDFIYFSFLYEGLEFFGEIDNEQVRFAYRETRVDIPTEIATATPILRYGTAGDLPESIAPNTLVMCEFSTTGNLSLPMLTGGEEGFDNKWKIRVTSTSSDLITIPFNVAWKGNNPPHWDEYSMCEFTFFKEAGSIFGEWAVYQPY